MAKKSVVLNVEERTETGSGPSRRYRREGKIPAIVYGKKDAPKNLLLSKLEWETLSRKGEIHLVELKTKTGDSINALIKEVQHDYLSGMTLHIDFEEVKMDEVIETSVAVHGKGTPIGLSQGGILEQVLHELDIACLPSDIPEFIEVDISHLEIDKTLTAQDILPPQGVKIINPPQQVVFHVIRLRAEAEAAPAEGAVAAEGAAPAEPELVGGKGKEKEEGKEETKEKKK